MPRSENHSRLAEYCCSWLEKSKLRAPPTQRPTSASAARSASPEVDSADSGSTQTTRAATSGTTIRSVVSISAASSDVVTWRTWLEGALSDDEEDEGQDGDGDGERERVGPQEAALRTADDRGRVEGALGELVEPALDDRLLDLVAKPHGERLRRAAEERVVELVEPQLVLEGVADRAVRDELPAGSERAPGEVRAEDAERHGDEARQPVLRGGRRHERGDD